MSRCYFPEPVIREHENIMVVRDDLLDGGSKRRFLCRMIHDSADNEFVYGASPASGYGQISLAMECEAHGKTCTLFAAKRRAKNLHPYQVKAASHGANFHWIVTGRLNVTMARARRYTSNREGARNMQIGLNCAEMDSDIVACARALPVTPTEVWSVGGSGALTRGLQKAWPKAVVYCVIVGRWLTPKQSGRAIVFSSPYKFEEPVLAADAPPFPSAPTYDAKAWPFIRTHASDGALFWNVGA